MAPLACTRWWSWALGTSLNCAAQLQQDCTPSPPTRLPSHTVPLAGAAKAQAGPSLSELMPLSPSPHCPPGAGHNEHMESTGNVLRASICEPRLRPTLLQTCSSGLPLLWLPVPPYHTRALPRTATRIAELEVPSEVVVPPLHPPFTMCLEENPEAGKWSGLGFPWAFPGSFPAASVGPALRRLLIITAAVV